MEGNRIRVTVNGMTFYVVGKENEAYVQMIAQKVDRKIEEAYQKNPNLSNTQAMTLAAFNLADEAYKSSGNGEDSGISEAQKKEWDALLEQNKEEVDKLIDLVRDRDDKIKAQEVQIKEMKKELKQLEQLEEFKAKVEQLLELNAEQLANYQRLKQEHDYLQKSYREVVKDGE